MRRPVTLLLALLALLAPASAALAQGAGDEQYADPFGEVDQPNEAQEPEQEAPAQTQTQAPSTPAAQADTVAQETAAPEAGSAQLPRSGFPVVMLVAFGWTLLVAGVAIRRGAAEPGPRS
jgi:hypothetical protein